MATRRVIIDTDPGIDDAQALLFALFCKEFQIDTLTTVFGNVPATTAAANALRLVEMAGRPEIPVHLGAAEPLVYFDPFSQTLSCRNDWRADSVATTCSRPRKSCAPR